MRCFHLDSNHHLKFQHTQKRKKKGGGVGEEEEEERFFEKKKIEDGGKNNIKVPELWNGEVEATPRSI